MPVKLAQDQKGFYYQYGNQKRYYFNPNNYKSWDNAHKKVLAQASAISIAKYYATKK
jgi:hypothetical protein